MEKRDIFLEMAVFEKADMSRNEALEKYHKSSLFKQVGVIDEVLKIERTEVLYIFFFYCYYFTKSIIMSHVVTYLSGWLYFW